jgi:hypothetical protein
MSVGCDICTLLYFDNNNALDPIAPLFCITMICNSFRKLDCWDWCCFVVLGGFRKVVYSHARLLELLLFRKIWCIISFCKFVIFLHLGTRRQRCPQLCEYVGFAGGSNPRTTTTSGMHARLRFIIIILFLLKCCLPTRSKRARE